MQDEQVLQGRSHQHRVGGVQSRSLPGLVRRQDRVPIVDAAMRQLKHCARMHNRTCMVVSSLLSKDLMIDSRRGERYFMEHLIDGDFAFKFQPLREGIWLQYGGVDPQPYFRISSSTRCDKVSDSKATGMENTFVNGCPSYGISRAIMPCNAIHEPFSRGPGGRLRLHRKMGTPDRSWRMRRVRVGIGRWHGTTPKKALESPGVNST